jgi:hypothetical protein
MIIAKHWPVLLLTYGLCTAGTGAADFCPKSIYTPLLDSVRPVALRVTSCPGADDEFDLVLELHEKGDTLQREYMKAQGLAYEVSIEQSLDLDGDGIRDVGIANGTGRDGDGKTYWLFKLNPLRLIRAGDAPNLSFSKPDYGLYALVPGGGEVQATRVEYQMKDGQLKAKRALQFVPMDDVGFEIREQIRTESSEFPWKAGAVKRATNEEGQRCMDGGECP